MVTAAAARVRTSTNRRRRRKTRSTAPTRRVGRARDNPVELEKKSSAPATQVMTCICGCVMVCVYVQWCVCVCCSLYFSGMCADCVRASEREEKRGFVEFHHFHFIAGRMRIQVPHRRPHHRRYFICVLRSRLRLRHSRYDSFFGSFRRTTCGPLCIWLVFLLINLLLSLLFSACNCRHLMSYSFSAFAACLCHACGARALPSECRGIQSPSFQQVGTQGSLLLPAKR